MNSEETSPCDLTVGEKNASLIRNLVETDGKLEAPINLDISFMEIIELNDLDWSNMDVPPKKLKLTNTGHTALISGKWQDETPSVSGGPLADKYQFSQVHFHWGKNDMIGSEHYIDGSSMPMELHAVYFKKDYTSMEIALRRDDGIIIIVYFFKIVNNHALDELVRSLSFIKTAESSVRMTPVALGKVTRPFTKDYFIYWGSISMPEHAHSILWMICREPIGISMEQVAEFRTLSNKRNVAITTNRRPLKERGYRHVFHVCPSGSTYASLLPIPRDFLTEDHIPSQENV